MISGPISPFRSNILYCRDISNEHQENLPSYIDEEGYEAVLKTLEKILDFFEDELGREDRQGRWLGGAHLSLADVTLGVFRQSFCLNFFVMSIMSLQAYTCTDYTSWD